MFNFLAVRNYGALPVMISRASIVTLTISQASDQLGLSQGIQYLKTSFLAQCKPLRLQVLLAMSIAPT